MSRSAVVIDPEFLKHEPGEFHPERPERLKVLLELTSALHGGMVQILPPRQATLAEIEACHGSQYIDLIRSTSETNRYALDGDTVTCADSFGTAVLAVGGFLRLLESMAAGEFQNGFAMVRPPGHHALKEFLIESISKGFRLNIYDQLFRKNQKLKISQNLFL